METTQHYVCRGDCGGVADAPQTCSAEGCTKHEVPLVACDCTDGEHTASSEA